MMTVLLGWCKLSCKGDTGQDVVEALHHVEQAKKDKKHLKPTKYLFKEG